jgi:predicted RNA binding protein YcfA (HicA-like mRNA interferase family)
MSKHAKLLRRLFSKPKDFTWSEVISLMEALGYSLKVTGGSHRKFIHSETKAAHFICEPHPSKVLKPYQVRDLIAFLKEQETDEPNIEISRI